MNSPSANARAASAADEVSPERLAVDAPSARQSLPILTWVILAIAASALLVSANLWLRLSSIQEALARQSADATAAALEGRTLARAAQETVKEMSTRQALMETRLAEVALQRGQLEELIQSLSRSRDENLVVDVDSALRLALQQANLTGSLEPLLAALRSAEQRVARAGQPRLSPLLRALAKDIDRVKSANVADTPSLLIKLDELVRMVDDMPIANAVAAMPRSASQAGAATLPTRSSAGAEPLDPDPAIEWPQWLRQTLAAVRSEVRALVRVGRIDTPEAALLSPQQSFFAQENLKLKLLNARLALLSRQFDSTRSDLKSAAIVTARYFDSSSRSVQQATQLMTQLQSQLQTADLPRIDQTLTALATLSASTAQSK